MRLYTKTICPKCLWVKSELDNANVEAEIISLILRDESIHGVAVGFFA